MSINKLISIENPIIDAMDQLGLDHDKDKPIFTRWATLAEKEINSYYQFKKQWSVLDITGCVAKLPSDARYVQLAILGDLGCECGDLFTTICSTITLSSATLNTSASGNTFLIVDVGEGYTTINGDIAHEIQDNKIILKTDAYDGDKITIQYLGYQRDEKGFIKVGENHVNAIKWNIIWLHYMRMRKMNGMDYGKMKIAKEEWDRECLNARAKDSELSDGERSEIRNMLYCPYNGLGMEIGQTPTFGY